MIITWKKNVFKSDENFTKTYDKDGDKKTYS